ncbi:MAG TPA: general glycosylation pathway protein, partial [Spirochaeta sp.]|nr:general glycosylation pathway protein [Spirochaeta sp.]
ADVVIACAKYPMDIDLYQSQKAIENAKLALKPDGTLILVSACRDGIGEDAFSRLLSSCSSPDAVFKKIEEGYKLGYHKAAKIAEICSTARVAAYTGLEPEVLKSVFIEPLNDLQKTIDDLLSGKPGSDAARVVIMPDASVTVPKQLKRWSR